MPLPTPVPIPTTVGVQEIHQNDAGLIFATLVLDENNTPIDFTNAITVEFHFQKPDGSMLIVPAQFTTDGTDGQLYYSTVSTDLDQSGTWQHQVYMVKGPETKWSTINKFKVKPNLPLGV